MTTLGPLKIERRYWQCPCSEGSYAADEVLGIGGRFSRVIQKHACRLSADLGFAKSAEHMQEMLGVHISVETLRKQVTAHGRSMAEFQLKDEETAEAFRRGSGKVEFSVDAGKVNTREEGWKDLKIAVVLKREAGSPRSPEEWSKPDLPKPTLSVSFAMIAPVKVFRRHWRRPLRQLGVSNYSELLVLGDGASWIWKAADRMLSGCQQTLYFYHASDRVSLCAKQIFGEENPEGKIVFERGRELLLSDGWTGVCQWVSELLNVEESERENRRRATEKLLGYFAKHMQRLNYRERLAEGRSIGSGAVEGQAKTLGLRLKNRGARWSKKNVRPMASLVCVRNSQQWDSYWNLAN